MSPYNSSLLIDPLLICLLIPLLIQLLILTYYLFSLLTVPLLMTLTHSPILYLDTDLPIYKSALSIPKTSDLTWLSS
jgi:hypothetical protein